MNNEVLNVSNLYYEIDKQVIFQDFCMSVKQGEIVSIIGANKCGKSTLIRLLSGFYLTENMVTVNKITLNKKSKDGFLKKVGRIDACKSKDSILVRDYIYLDVKKKDNAYFDYLVDLFAIKPYLNKNISGLSQDDFIRVEFCKNLMKKPNVLFIDYTNLYMSNALRTQLHAIYKVLVKEKIAIVFVTNEPSDLLVSDTTYVIHKGVIALSGETKEVLKQDSFLLKLGIELPFEVDLSLKLSMYGLVDKIYYDIEELVNVLWK